MNGSIFGFLAGKRQIKDGEAPQSLKIFAVCVCANISNDDGGIGKSSLSPSMIDPSKLSPSSYS